MQNINRTLPLVENVCEATIITQNTWDVVIQQREHIVAALQDERIVFIGVLCRSMVVSGGKASMVDEGMFYFAMVVDEGMGNEYESTNIAALISSK